MANKVGAGCEEPVQRGRRGRRGRETYAADRHQTAVVVVDVAEYERLRRLERARAPSFADLPLSMPQDGGEFSRHSVRMRDLEL